MLGVLAGRRLLACLAALVASVVPWWSIDDARSLTGRDPRLDVAAWIDRNVPRAERVAADPSTLPLEGRDVVRLELPGPGRLFDPRRDVETLQAQGVRWLVVGGSVTDRVLAADEHYPARRASTGGSAILRPAYATPVSDRRPWLRVYRI